jgi:hypothetical protein
MSDNSKGRSVAVVGVVAPDDVRTEEVEDDPVLPDEP